MMTQEELTLHIRKKFGAGYGEDELRNELLVQGYSEMEISNAILLAQKEEKKPVSPLAIVVSVLFIGAPGGSAREAKPGEPCWWHGALFH